MTARLLVAPARLAAGPLVVTGDNYAYLFRVRRLALGDVLVVFDGAGREAPAEVASVGPATATLTIGSVRTAPRPGPHVTVLQAVIKGERMDWCLEKLVEVGVDAIVPCTTARTVVRLDEQRRASRHERHRALAAAAARQCGRADLPDVAAAQPLAQALAAVTAERRLVAHPGGTTLGPTHATGASVAVLIGPEGGLTDDELALAADRGFAAIALGPTILRAETAGLLAAAAIRLFAPPPVGAV
ncbi:MAG: 16S rRNA (uracil(1498)-N(3))-methyltransferase [Myxococcales bacterium]|nr:16S rRNA (uracil(1498)-N(3))-methyltransferase [Myxococcales bacterium]